MKKGMHDYEEPKEKSAHFALEERLLDDGDIKERQYNIGQYCTAMGYGALQYWPMTATATELNMKNNLKLLEEE